MAGNGVGGQCTNLLGEVCEWDSVTGQVFLGSEAFVKRLRSALPDTDLREVPRAQRRPPAPALSAFLDWADRHAAMAQAYRSGAYTMREIGDAFGVHYATVNRAVRRR